MMTLSEENYLKTIYHITEGSSRGCNTNAIAEKIETKASSVTDMLKKLAEKDLVEYKKYKGVTLSEKGKLSAIMIIRKHRLWEVFLVEKLGFAWDEVHEIAEQLEHIKSDVLISKLDNFLGSPALDPHGDPIPDAQGKIESTGNKLLSDINPGQKTICVGVRDSSSTFLKYLDRQKIALGSEVEVIAKESFDDSIIVRVDGTDITISNKIAINLYVKTT